MLSSERIVISTKNHKVESFDSICAFVRFLVRHSEYEKITKTSGDFATLKKKIEDAHTSTDVLTCEEDVIKSSLTPAEAEIFLTLREEVLYLKDAIQETGKTLEDFNSLSDTDRVFITLQAHTAMKSIKLDKSILNEIDLSKPIGKYFSSGSLKGIKDIFRTIFAKVVGQEGQLFYGVKLKKSDFSDGDLRNCLAYFRGNAARTASSKGGTKAYGEYDWIRKDESKDAQAMALTNLFAVILDRNKDYEVIKPETK